MSEPTGHGVAGIVVYTRKGSALEGWWTHPDINGLRGREVVHDVAPGPLEGDWLVDIFLPDGTEPYWTGRLRSRYLGSALSLEWTGRRVSDNQPLTFIGIGADVTLDILVASFQEVRGTTAAS